MVGLYGFKTRPARKPIGRIGREGGTDSDVRRVMAIVLSYHLGSIGYSKSDLYGPIWTLIDGTDSSQMPDPLCLHLFSISTKAFALDASDGLVFEIWRLCGLHAYLGPGLVCLDMTRRNFSVSASLWEAAFARTTGDGGVGLFGFFFSLLWRFSFLCCAHRSVVPCVPVAMLDFWGFSDRSDS